MNLPDSILLAIADKLLIGVILLVAGFWLNERLEKLKGSIALQNAIAPQRALAYGELWKLTQPLTPRGIQDLPGEDQCAKALAEIRDWYYADLGAMYLSFDASDHCLSLLNALEEGDPPAAKYIASKLRTQLKVDVGSYRRSQAERQLPRPR